MTVMFVETDHGFVNTAAVKIAKAEADGTCTLVGFNDEALGRTLEVTDPDDWGMLLPVQVERWATVLRVYGDDFTVSRRLIVGWRDHARCLVPAYLSPLDIGETAFLKGPDGRLVELGGEHSVTVSSLDEAKRLVLWRAEQSRKRHERRQQLSMAAE
jgi:hypothetical protein